MEKRSEQVEILEGGTEASCAGRLVVNNVEVGMDAVVVRLKSRDFPAEETTVPIGGSMVYDAGQRGRFDVRLVAVEEGDLEADIPAGARFAVTCPKPLHPEA
jgi:hypothetical protein